LGSGTSGCGWHRSLARALGQLYFFLLFFAALAIGATLNVIAHRARHGHQGHHHAGRQTHRPHACLRRDEARYRLSLLLALEVAKGRATADRHGAARIDPADERGETALGRAAHPRRTAQARVRDRAVKRRQVHGQTTGAAQPGMADLLA
jgi:hypothetical protein